MEIDSPKFGFRRFFCQLFLSLLVILAVSQICVNRGYAHTSDNFGKGDFSSGFFHPMGGMDHVLAMVSVGLWGAFLGPPALWMLPVVFPLIMSLGAIYGILGFPLSHLELGIAFSVIILGLVILLKFRPPVSVATCIVAFFAVFHGYAHGAELPKNADALSYSIGFVLATGMLHLTGIAFGCVTRLPKGDKVLQGGGLLISCLGGYLLFKLISG